MEKLFWYVSRAKLEALGAHGGSWRDRLGGKARLGFGAAGVEVGLDPIGSGNPRIARAVARAESKIEQEEEVVAAEDVPRRGAVRYFRWAGPSARATVHDAEEGIFWTAAVCGEVGVLLVGSLANAIGSTQAVAFSPSVDPVGAVKQMFDTSLLTPASHSEQYQAFAVYGWAQVMDSGLGDLASLPHTSGIAQYAGGREVESPVGLAKELGIRHLVVGSPIWVEQVSSSELHPR